MASEPCRASGVPASPDDEPSLRRYMVRVAGHFDLPSGACITDTAEMPFPSPLTDEAPARAAMGLVRDLSRGMTVTLNGREMFAWLREVRSVRVQWDEAAPVVPLRPEAGRSRAV